MNNPYDMGKNEAKHHTWAHGFNALSKEDNPYSDQTDEDGMTGIWMQGFNANKNRAKPKPNPVVESAVIVSRATPAPVTQPISSLAEVSTEELLAEVARRMKDFETTLKQMKKVFG